jgi:tetratricopeptide (TPR) repeat protein
VAERRRSNQGLRPTQRAQPTKRSQNQPHPGLARRPTEPPVPEGVDTRVLHRSVRAELRGLPKELAEIVAAHLVAAGQLIDDDPDLAYAHAEAARRRAARLPIVREAAAETAYAAGHYDTALSELRAIRRMTGSDDYLPMMADCERALGRPEAALKLAKEAKRLRLDPAQRGLLLLGCGMPMQRRCFAGARRQRHGNGSRRQPNLTSTPKPTLRPGWTSWTVWCWMSIHRI